MSHKGDFLEEYINLTASIGRVADQLAWYSCTISSKNRFYDSFTNLLQEKKKPVGYPASYIKNFLGSLRYVIVQSIKIGLNKVFRSSKVEGVKDKLQAGLREGKKNVLVKTFAFAGTPLRPYQDPMFGNLGSFLHGKGYNVATLIEHQQSFFPSILKFDPDDMNLSYFDFFKFKDICSACVFLIKKYFSEARKIFDLTFQGRGIGEEFRSLYLLELTSPTTLHNLTFYYVYKNLLGHFPIERYFYTYENNSWERTALMALRKYSPQTHIVGYQHNVIPMAAANFFYGRGEEDSSPAPSIILTTGSKPKDILQRYGHYNKMPIGEACALRYQYLNNFTPYADNRKKKRLLVALEGTWQTSSIVNALLKQVDSLAEWNIVVRAHPALPYKDLRKYIEHDIDRYSNFALSKNLTVQEDVRDASAVLYWGSTVSLEAVMMGRPVIHINLGGELSFDPLFELTEFKAEWIPSQPLNVILNHILRMKDSIYYSNMEVAREYLAHYFHPVTKERLEAFV